MVADALGIDARRRVARPNTPGPRRPRPRLVADRGGLRGGDRGQLAVRVGDRTVVSDLNVRWKKAPTLEPDWEIEDGYDIECAGTSDRADEGAVPSPPDFQGETLADFMVLGHIMTAMPAVNAIPAGGGGRRAGHRELPRPAAAPPTRARQSLRGVSANFVRAPRPPSPCPCRRPRTWRRSRDGRRGAGARGPW